MTTTGQGQGGAAAVTRVSMLGGATGEWQVEAVRAIRGESLPTVAALGRVEAPTFVVPGATPGGGASDKVQWTLRGVRSNERYLERGERERLAVVQEGLGRADSTLAVLIPMRKSAAWWELPQDERRAIFEAKSHHIAVGSQYLPAVARRLYHSRDLGEPFDFLTWFEFAASNAGAFDELVGRLRESEEWRFVDREVEIRLQRPLAATVTASR